MILKIKIGSFGYLKSHFNSPLLRGSDCELFYLVNPLFCKFLYKDESQIFTLFMPIIILRPKISLYPLTHSNEKNFKFNNSTNSCLPLIQL